MSDTRYSFHTATEETLPIVCRLIEQVHGHGAAALTSSLALHLPGMVPADVLWLRDDATGEAVSTLSLIPWRWRLGVIEFSALETGVVATAETHRNQGLSSRLMDEALKVRQAKGVAVSVIQGIPYFYRRFGYEHALPLETHVELEFRHLPSVPAGWVCRPATRDDLPRITAWSTEATATHDVASVRTVDHWAYRLEHSHGTETETTFWLVCDPHHAAQGFFGLAANGFGEGLIVAEAGGEPGAWPAVAAFSAQQARERGKPYVRLNLGQAHPFVRWAGAAGGRFTGSWNWQIRLDDPQAALDAVLPVLQERWGDHPVRRVTLNLYGGRSVELNAGTKTTTAAETLTVSLPPEVLTKLLFGWKTPVALREFYPEFFGPPAALDLLDRLFPKLDGFCGSIY